MQLNLISPTGPMPPPDLPNLTAPPTQIILHHGRDPVMERLVRALLPEKEAGEVLLGFYTDALQPRR